MEGGGSEEKERKWKNRGERWEESGEGAGSTLQFLWINPMATERILGFPLGSIRFSENKPEHKPSSGDSALADAAKRSPGALTPLPSTAAQQYSLYPRIGMTDRSQYTLNAQSR